MARSSVLLAATVATMAVLAVVPSANAQIDLNDLLGGFNQGAGSMPQQTVCPVGQVEAPTENPEYKFECNGCGPKGMQVAEPYGLFKCCNGHDLCYSTCGTKKEFCEKTFKSCMKQVCSEKGEEQEACNKQADSLSGLTAAFGGSFHLKSQTGDAEKGRIGACDCYDSAEAANDRWTKLFTEFYVKHAEMSEAEAAVKAAEVLSKNANKKGEAYFKMIKKYQNSTKQTEFIWDNVKDEL